MPGVVPAPGRPPGGILWKGQTGDILPDLLEAAGIEHDSLQGVNVLANATPRPAFSSTTLGRVPGREETVPKSCVSDGDWKLIKWYEGPVSLFNLKEDLAEKNDLARRMPEKVAALDRKRMAHLRGVTDRIPVPNPRAGRHPK